MIFPWGRAGRGQSCAGGRGFPVAFALPASPGIFFRAVCTFLRQFDPSKVLNGFESVWRMAANVQEERPCQGEILCQMLTGGGGGESNTASLLI